MKTFSNTTRQIFLAAFTCIWLPFQTSAASDEEIETLSKLLETDEMIAIIREEGLMQADELEADMFPGRGGERWMSGVDALYDNSRLSKMFHEVFAAGLADTDVSGLIAYFQSEGGEIIALELSARRAFMDEDVEDAAREAFRVAAPKGGARLDQLAAFDDANDLVEFNVMGALNSSLSFYKGLVDGGAFELTEEQMLNDVWGREPEIREDSSEWLYAFMLMAYEPLSDEALQDYILISDGDAGRDLNAALFAAFNAMFEDVSYSLGFAASQMMVGDDI